MPRKARIPKVDRTDEKLERLARLVEEMVDEQCGGSDDWMEQSRARRQIFELLTSSELLPGDAKEREDPIH
jgi:hypothetical protein